MKSLTLALDAMGGDFGPHVAVYAAIKALQKHTFLSIFLFGDEHTLSRIIEEQKLHNLSAYKRLKIVHTKQVVSMDDNPISALRHATDSSMRVALDWVKAGHADACVSSGNTGALIGMSKVILGTVPHIDRPALITPIPYKPNKMSYLLDVGARLSCDSEVLHQLAMMGSAHFEAVHHQSKPRVALLNVGKELVKGTDQIQRADQYLKACPVIHYIGFIEGDDLFKGVADVIVCDGFVGNIVLKSSEGLLRHIFNDWRLIQTSSKWVRWVASIMEKYVKQSLPMINPDYYNGATLVGLPKVVVKSHGNAREEAVFYAIEKAITAVQEQLPTKISNCIELSLLKSLQTPPKC